MKHKIAQRLLDIINALPLVEDSVILEVGCGTGVVARELSRRIAKGYVVAIDRSSKAINKAISISGKELEKGNLRYITAKIEDLDTGSLTMKFDLALAIRVGAFDGRHPELEMKALEKVATLLKPKGKFFIDGGKPVRELDLSKFR